MAVSFIAIRCIFVGLYFFQNGSDWRKFLDSAKVGIKDPIATSIPLSTRDYLYFYGDKILFILCIVLFILCIVPLKLINVLNIYVKLESVGTFRLMGIQLQQIETVLQVVRHLG